MDSRIVATVHQWLSLMQISLPKQYVSRRLKSHPDFPSASSITDLLDEIGIGNSVLKIEEEQLDQLPTPFLAFVDAKEFLIVSQVREVKNLITSRRWDGIVIIAEKTSPIIASPAIKKSIASSFETRIKMIFALAVSLALSSVVIINLNSADIVIFLLSTIGVLLSVSLVLYETGIQTQLSRHLCGVEENTGCSVVSKSKLATFFFNIKLSDICLSFFSGIILVLSVGSIAGEGFLLMSHAFIAVFSFFTIPFTVFSLYYQGRILKTWCATCMLIIMVLWMITLTQLLQRFENSTPNIITIAAVSGIFFLPGSLWLLVRKLLNEKQELLYSTILLQQFYRSPELFKTHLLNQPKMDIQLFAADFKIGNHLAPCQLVVVSSHFCGPCVETYELLQNLLRKHQEELGITIRFLIKDENQENTKPGITKYMLQYALSTEGFMQQPEKVEHMLEVWYRIKDIEKFAELYPVTKEVGVDNNLMQLKSWLRSVEITSTPTIFINGYRLISPYAHQDLLEFASVMIEIFSDEESERKACSSHSYNIAEV